jgi:diguanylate cyclase (GGDEF)-like protein
MKRFARPSTTRCRQALVALALAWTVLPALAQRYAFRAYTQAEGLQNLATRALAQGADGRLWVGTENGLYRFDADRFTRIEPATPTQRASINALHADAAGRIWVGSNDGLFLVEGNRLRAVQAGDGTEVWHGQHFASGPAAPGRIFVVLGRRLAVLSQATAGAAWTLAPAFDAPTLAAHPELERIASVAVGAAGELWLGCAEALCRWQDGRLERWDEQRGVPRGRWGGLLLQHDGRLWARAERELLELSPDTGRVRRHLPADADKGTVHKPLPLAEDADGRVVTFADDGLLRQSGDGWEHIAAAQGLNSGGSVDALLTDRDGTLWVASAGRGLIQWLGNGRIANWTVGEGLPSDDLWSFLRDSRGTLHVGTGIGRATLGERTAHAGRDGDVAHQAGALAEDRGGQLWVGMFSGVLMRLDRATGRARTIARLPLILRLLVDGAGRLWICTEHGIYVIDEPGEPRPLPRLVDEGAGLARTRTASTSWACESPDGTLWFATAGDVIRQRAQGWDRVPMRLHGDPAQAPRGVTTLACAPDGSVWLGELDTGKLWRLAPGSTPAWELEDRTPPAMNGRHLQALLLDHRGWVWLSTDNGVAVGDGRRWRYLTQEDGLTWNDGNQNALYEDLDGSVWIGSSAGASHVTRPEALFGIEARPLLVEALRRDGHDVAPGAALSFPWSRGSLDLVLADPVYRRPGDRILLSRLEGLEDAWTSRHDLELHYAALPPGRYRLEVQVARSELQTRSPVTSIAFEIRPPWWRTWPFVIAAVLAAALSVLGLVQWRTRRLARRQVELETLVGERTRELKDSHERMRLLALRDGLTQTWNRRAVMDALDRELARCGREGRPLTIVMIDADHFKRVNDTHGHPAGDAVLCEIARRLGAEARSYDTLGRYGGEEFLLLLPNLACDDGGGRERIEAFHRAASDAPMTVGDGIALHVTCSFGAATAYPGNAESRGALIARADTALYAAKAGGRNRVACG